MTLAIFHSDGRQAVNMLGENKQASLTETVKLMQMFFVQKRLFLSDQCYF